MILKDLSEELISPAYQRHVRVKLLGSEVLRGNRSPSQTAMVTTCIWNQGPTPVWAHAAPNARMKAFQKTHIWSLFFGKEANMVIINTFVSWYGFCVFAYLLSFQQPNSNTKLVTGGLRLDHDMKLQGLMENIP